MSVTMIARSGETNMRKSYYLIIFAFFPPLLVSSAEFFKSSPSPLPKLLEFLFHFSEKMRNYSTGNYKLPTQDYSSEETSQHEFFIIAKSKYGELIIAKNENEKNQVTLKFSKIFTFC